MYSGIYYDYVGPSGYPPYVNVISLEDLTAKFRWSKLECMKQNGPIIGYEYRLETEFETFIGRVGPEETSYTAVFKKHTVAKFSVAAVNIVGMGDYSPNIKFRIRNVSKKAQGKH